MRIAVTTMATTWRNMMRDMIDLKRSTLRVLRHDVAQATDGIDLHLCTTVRELPAQTMDVDLDGIRRNIAGDSENLVFHELLRNDIALAPHQELEHRGLAGGEDLRVFVDEDLPAFGIENNIGQAQRAPEQLAWPSQQCLEARHQLVERKGFHQIIVSPAAQPVDAVRHAAARRQNQDGDRILAMAQQIGRASCRERLDMKVDSAS